MGVAICVRGSLAGDPPAHSRPPRRRLQGMCHPTEVIVRFRLRSGLRRKWKRLEGVLETISGTNLLKNAHPQALHNVLAIGLFTIQVLSCTKPVDTRSA